MKNSTQTCILEWAIRIFLVLVIFGLIGGLIWFQTHVPCGWYRFSRSGDLPARCLAYYQGN